jgi:hypothetical protein
VIVEVEAEVIDLVALFREKEVAKEEEVPVRGTELG